MALATKEIIKTYPLPIYNFRVEIGQEAASFSEVSGLTIGYEVTTYKESPLSGVGPRTMHMPAQVTPPTITLKKGLVRKESLKTLYDWISQTAINQIDKRDITIILLDEKGDPVISWKVNNAFPIKLSAPTFDTKSNDVSIETMELKADFITISEQ